MEDSDKNWTSNHSVNDTITNPYEITYHWTSQVRSSIYYAYLLPIAIFGNLLTIFICLRILTHRKSIPDLLYLCLATSDLVCVLAVHLPVLVALAAGEWMGGIYTCAFQYFMAWSCLKMSYFIIVLMTIDRYSALCQPLYYHTHFKKQRKMNYCVFGFFLYSCISTSITIITNSHSIFLLKYWYVCMNTWSSNDPYTQGSLIVNGSIFILLVGVFIFCNVSVVQCLRRRLSTNELCARVRREDKFAKVIVLLSVVFVLAWTPYLVCQILFVSLFLFVILPLSVHVSIGFLKFNLS